MLIKSLKNKLPTQGQLRLYYLKELKFLDSFLMNRSYSKTKYTCLLK